MTFTDWDGKKYLVKVKSYNIFKRISAADTKYHYLCSGKMPSDSRIKCYQVNQVQGYIYIQMLGLGFCVSEDFSITVDSLSHWNHNCLNIMVLICTSVSKDIWCTCAPMFRLRCLQPRKV